MRRALLAAIVLALWPTTAAQAGWRIDRATAIAEHVWRICPGQLQVHFADPASRGLGPATTGWADEGGCDVYLNPGQPTADYFETFCSAVLHETGHAARFRDPLNMDPRHSHNPRSVMYARPMISIEVSHVWSGKRWSRSVDVSGTDARCRGRGRPYMEREGLMSQGRR
jgi:hypothetical protein